MYEYLDRRYALALYNIGEEQGKVEEFINDLKEVVNLIKDNPGFLDVIKHPHLSTSRKKEMFESIFGEAVDKELLSFLTLLIEKDRILQLDSILDQIQKIHLERNNTLLALVKSVIHLDKNDKDELVEKLQRKYDKKIILEEEIDASIIGGLYVRVGNDVIDGTVRAKLDEMKKLMLKRE